MQQAKCYLVPPLTGFHGSEPCAEQYEPPGFRALDEEEAGFFARRPFAMDIGTVATQYHGVRLRVSSSLECLCLYLRTQCRPLSKSGREYGYQTCHLSRVSRMCTPCAMWPARALV